MIDLRVGHILKAIKHPDADSLYVSTIDMGDLNDDGDSRPRTVCSGLVHHFSLEEMQNRMVVVVANLKPVKMRGIKSEAMVLCASGSPSGSLSDSPSDSPSNGSSKEEIVEFVNPPAGSKPGDRIFFESFGHVVPEPILSPKKKVWETLQPLFVTTSDLGVVTVVYRKEGESDKRLVNGRSEVCLVSSLVNAPVR